jgi:hypothetical protein
MVWIDHGEIRQWGKSRYGAYAAAIALNCPHCSDKVTVNLGTGHYDGLRDTYASTGRCPSCTKKIHSWTILASLGTKETGRCRVTVFPEPTEPKAVLAGAEQIPGPIRRQYKSAIDSYNSGVWVAVGVLARRTLEAMTDDLLPETEHKGTLADRLNKLPKHVDLGKPIVELQSIVRLGGNLSAHFREDVEPTDETAQEMLKFIELLLQFVYVVPGQIDDFRKHIEELENP